MSIVVIRATIECDGCDKHFRVELDPARKAWKPQQALADFADDTVRGGVDVIDGVNSSSVQHGMHLCAECTRKADAIGDEDHEPTEAEIRAALA